MKDEYKMDISQTMVRFEKTGEILKNQLSSLVARGNTGFYTWNFHTFHVYLNFLWGCCFPVGILKNALSIIYLCVLFSI